MFSFVSNFYNPLNINGLASIGVLLGLLIQVTHTFRQTNAAPAAFEVSIIHSFQYLICNYCGKYRFRRMMMPHSTLKKRPVNRLSSLLGYRIARPLCHVNTNL